MKRIFMFVFITVPLSAQWIVNDPVNTSVNTAIQAGQAANHLEVLRQWAEQLERLNRQIRQIDELLTTQRRIREVMGDPSAAGVQVVLRDLGATELSRSYGETLRAVQRLTDAAASLRRTAEGIYEKLEDRTVTGREFRRSPAPYRRYAAVDRQADNVDTVHDETRARIVILQAEVAAAVDQLRAAPTQADVDKLNARIAVLNGQLAQLDARRRDESDKLNALQIQNENQAAKERQDLWEKQIAEERDTLAVVGAWQQRLRLTPATYHRP